MVFYFVCLECFDVDAAVFEETFMTLQNLKFAARKYSTILN